MVKSIIYTLAAILLSVVFFVWTDKYIGEQFGRFHSAVETLYEKTEQGEAVREDAYAVRALWEDKKEKLHVFIPHNDIAQVDYYLSEACALIYKSDFTPALGKLEALLEISKTLPDAYRVRLENIF